MMNDTDYILKDMILCKEENKKLKAENKILKENYKALEEQITTLYVLMSGMAMTYNTDLEDELEEI